MSKETRYDEMREQVIAFHKANPRVMELFERFTFELIRRGFKNYSSKAIFERIRWETDQADYDGRSTFKMNNNYTSFYGRAFMNKYPEHDGFFRTRRQVSKEVSATHLPPLGPQDFDAVG